MLYDHCCPALAQRAILSSTLGATVGRYVYTERSPPVNYPRLKRPGLAPQPDAPGAGWTP
jgi:hypothetical protein